MRRRSKEADTPHSMMSVTPNRDADDDKARVMIAKHRFATLQFLDRADYLLEHLCALRTFVTMNALLLADSPGEGQVIRQRLIEMNAALAQCDTIKARFAEMRWENLGEQAE